MKNFNFSEIILTKNPATGKHFNLMPLFQTAFEFTEKDEPALRKIKQKIDEAIRLISTNRFEEQLTDEYAKGLTHDLYEISDMFEKMEDF